MKKINKKYIFISYSHEDLEFVRTDIYQMKFMGGINIWFDEGLLGGQDWERVVKEKIFDPNCVGTIFFLTAHFLTSNAIQKEISYVMQRKDSDPSFHYASVNEGGKDLVDFIRESNQKLSNEEYIQLLNIFNDRIIHFTRNSSSNDYLEKLQRTVIEWGAVNEQTCNEIKEYLIKPVIINEEKGVQILKYSGSENNIVIPPFINAGKVLALSEDAFLGYKGESITIPDGVLRIGAHCFDGCNELKTINIPDSVTEIGYEAFRNASKLEEITLPSHLTKLGGYCFYRCHSLKSILFTNKVSLSVHIGFAAFSECINLISINLPHKISFLGGYAFNKCLSLKQVVFHDLGVVGREIFHNCAKLQSVTFYNIPKSVGEDLFPHCLQLKHIRIGQNNYDKFIESDDWQAYKELFVEQLIPPKEIKIRNNCISWYPENSRTERFIVRIKNETNNTTEIKTVIGSSCDYSFDESRYEVAVLAMANLENQVDSDYSTPFSFGYETDACVLSEDGTKLIEYNGDSLSPIIPKTVTVIGKSAFKQSSIKEINFGLSKVIEIEDSAFEYCTNLVRFDMPDTIERVGDKAFLGCERLTRINFSNKLSSLGKYTFAYCTAIKKIDLQHTVLRIIPERCFYRCELLEKLYLPNTIEELGEACLRGAVLFKELNIGKTTYEKIAISDKQYKKAHYENTAKGVLRIKPLAFSFTVGMKEFTIPKNLVECGEGAFYYTSSLMHFISDNKRFISDNGVLIDKDNSTLLNVPANKNSTELLLTVDNIQKLSIDDLDYIESVTLSNIKNIDNENFNFCKQLKSIRIKGEQITIGNQCFSNNPRLKVLSIEGFVSFVGNNCFENNAEGFRIVVQDALYDQYINNPSWSGYASIIIRKRDE